MSDLTKPSTTERDALAILGFADSLDGRALVAEAKSDLLPYEEPFEIEAELIEGKAEKNFDNRGFRVKLKVLSSTNPTKVKVNQTYTLWFFDQHKTLPSQVLANMVQDRIRFAAAYAGWNEGDPTAEGPDGMPVFKSAPTLLEIHREVEPLGVRMRFKNEYERTTRNGKKLHKLSFEMV